MKNKPDSLFFNRQFCAEAQNCCERREEITKVISPRGLSVRHFGMEGEMKKAGINYQVWIWGLGLLVIICDILLGLCLHNIIMKIYPAKFPDIYVGSYTILPLLAYMLWLSPIVVEIILIFTYFSKKEKKSLGDVGIAASFLPISFFTYGIGFIILMVLPPISSHTTDIDDYLVFDEEIAEYEKDIYDLLPSEIPEDAENVSYEYFMYESFFSKEFSVKLSFALPQAEYDSLKRETLEAAKTIESKDDKDTEYYISFTNSIARDPVMILKTDDNNRRIEYYIQGEKNI